MSEPERPPLHPITCEQIDVLLHKVDERHWRLIAAMRAPVFSLPSTPPPPKLPLQLLNGIQVYASVLFKTEADQYEQFRDDGRYPAWLSKLTDRITEHILGAVERIEKGNPLVTLRYHGVWLPEMREALREILDSLKNHYAWRDAGPAVQAKAVNTKLPAATALAIEPVSKASERKALFDVYRSAFPDAGIMDICWAARQHYREWVRWLKSELKEGSKPDRSFRHVLLSGKAPSALRKEMRPKGWK